MPAALRQSLEQAVTAGREDAAGWARIHPTGSTERFDRDALAAIGPPPGADVQAAELVVLHQAQDSRTAEGTALALQYARRAGWETWDAAIAEIGTSQGAAQARRAQRLVEEATRRTDEVSQTAKQQYGRLRPYEVDSTLTPVVAKPHKNASYPSGHASGAYAAALVLASMLPERAAELVDVAAQVAYSRVYGGVHFPSDVVTGARIASRIVADVLRRDALD